MASAAREYRYAHREFSTNGSLARDLDWAVRERELEHAGEVPRHERTQAAPKVYHKEQVLVRERQAIPVLSVLGVTAVAVAAVGDGFLRARTPVLDFHKGYCDFCGKCIEVCPTGALRSFDETAEKLGVAVVQKPRCLS